MSFKNSDLFTILRGRGWLSAMPQPFQDKILERCHVCAFKSGQPVYHVGDPPGGLYGLINGALNVSIPSSIGENGLAHVGLPGTWFGEASAFSREPRRVSLTCVRATTLAHLSLPEFERIVEEQPGDWRFFSAILLFNLDTALRAGMDLMIRDANKRCLATLLRLAGIGAAGPVPPGLVDLAISQDDLASLANLSRNAAGAILRELEDQELVRLSYRRITIIDSQSIQRMLVD